MTTTHQFFPFTCRCCARCESEAAKDVLKLQSIHKRPPGSISLMSIADIFIETTPRVNIKYDDELPQLICSNCVEKVVQMQKFLDMCIESERIMRSIVGESKISQATEGLYTSIDSAVVVCNGKKTKVEKVAIVEIAEDSSIDELILPNALVAQDDVKVQPTINSYFEVSMADELMPTNTSSLPSSAELKDYSKVHMNESTKIKNTNDFEDIKIRNEKPVKCRFCGLVVLTRSSLTRHLLKHIGDNIYSCKRCPCYFLTAAELRKHYVEHKNDDDANTKEENLAARKTNEAELRRKPNITTADDLTVEEKSNTDSKITENATIVKEELELMDDYTDMKEEQEDMLTENELESDIANEANQATTNKCFEITIENEPLSDDDDASILDKPKIIISKTDKEKHTNNVIDETKKRKVAERNAANQNDCEICGRVFKDSYALNVHVHTHTKKKPYKCQYCDFATTTHSTLVKHQDTHNAETKANKLAARRKKEDKVIPDCTDHSEDIFVKCDCVQHDECPLLVTVNEII